MRRMADWVRGLAREIYSEQGIGIEVYHYFARSVGLLLSIAVSVIMLYALYYLFAGLIETLLKGPPSFEYAIFQHFFEMVLTALIALEFNHTLTEVVTGRGGLIQVKAVVLIGILVVVRKFILIEIETTSPLFLMGLGLAILALGVVYWLVVDVDRKAARAAAGS